MAHWQLWRACHRKAACELTLHTWWDFSPRTSLRSTAARGELSIHSAFSSCTSCSPAATGGSRTRPWEWPAAGTSKVQGHHLAHRAASLTSHNHQRHVKRDGGHLWGKAPTGQGASVQLQQVVLANCSAVVDGVAILVHRQVAAVPLGRLFQVRYSQGVLVPATASSDPAGGRTSGSSPSAGPPPHELHAAAVSPPPGLHAAAASPPPGLPAAAASAAPWFASATPPGPCRRAVAASPRL